MSIDVSPRGGAATHLTLDVQGLVAHVRLNRPAKRNALNDALIAELHSTFINLPDGVRAVVLSGEGKHGVMNWTASDHWGFTNETG